MWELGCEESWAPKNWCFWTVVLEKTLESPLDCKEIQPVHSKGDQSWVFFGRNDAKAETPVLQPLHAKGWPLEKTLMLAGTQGRWKKARQRMRWLDGITDSMTWVWVNSRSWRWTGRPGVLRFMGSQTVRHNWATELNWTECQKSRVNRKWNVPLFSAICPATPRPSFCLICLEFKEWDFHLIMCFISSNLSKKSLSNGSDGKESACNDGDTSSIPGWEDPLQKGMATHSSILAWWIPWTEEPGGLQSMESQRVGHDWATSLHFTKPLDLTVQQILFLLFCPDLSNPTFFYTERYR